MGWIYLSIPASLLSTVSYLVYHFVVTFLFFGCQSEDSINLSYGFYNRLIHIEIVYPNASDKATLYTDCSRSVVSVGESFSTDVLLLQEVDPSMYSHRKKGDGPSGQQKRKHQITYLAFQVSGAIYSLN